MKIVVDADSCPRQIRSIIRKAACRLSLDVHFAADRDLADCTGPNLFMHVVPSGMDEADRKLESLAEPGDLAITRDIILAANLVTAGCVVLDDRGGLYTEENMAERLSLRNIMTDFRNAGIHFERNRPLSQQDVQKFANALDRQLTRMLKP